MASSTGQNRPNILLICVDQWRGDCLSVLGHPVVQTPFLDKLALSGTRFTHAYSATPTCIAARAALLTGLSQKSHGRVGYQDGVPWNYPVTLAGEFARHGYQTQAVGKMHVYPERQKMGFENVVLHDGFLHYARSRHDPLDEVDDYLPWLRKRLGYEADYFDHGIGCNSVVARPWDKPEQVHPTNFVTTKAMEFLRMRDRQRPFFLFASYVAPHPPYVPPAWALEQYLHEKMPSPPVGDWVKILAPYAQPHHPECFVDQMAPKVLQRARAGYYGHMSHLDQQINRIVESLPDVHADKNTYICFVSDHGEMLGDHHLFRKGYAYEGSAHVPLILTGPAGSGIQAKASCDALAELRDIMPTLLDCAGLDVPRSVEGRSLLPLAREQKSPVRKYLHGEHVIFGQSMHFVTDGHEKYIWWSGTGHEQLFDLAHDPQEKRDLARRKTSASRLTHWRKILISELAGREEGFTDGRKLIPGRPVQPVLSFVLPKHQR
jgi:arylsulfatase A-like enzyme